MRVMSNESKIPVLLENDIPLSLMEKDYVLEFKKPETVSEKKQKREGEKKLLRVYPSAVLYSLPHVEFCISRSCSGTIL